MEAIVLAGGFGTRLAHIVKDVPKPMAPINGKPFLWYMFKYLRNNGVNRVILATGYMHNVIENYFGNNFMGIEIVYSQEISPLGTGGAIKKALSLCKNKDVFVINGDTFFNIKLRIMLKKHLLNDSFVTVATKYMKDFSRYGCVKIHNNKIIEFLEKKPTELGYINGGIYLLNKNLLNDIQKENFSFETDFLEKDTFKKNINCYKSKAYFIDIGVEEDYYRATKEMV